jgi:hypothetical protein
MPRPEGPAVLEELRDTLARSFAEEIAAHLPQAIELLEQQLAAASQREQWKQLRAAIELLGGMRGTLAARLSKEVAERFDAKLKPGDDVFGKTARFSLDSLALVADDQVSEEIAIGNCAKRLREQLGEELFALTQRLGALMGAENLSDERNPAFPRIFARGLYDALAAPGAETAARLAAFSALGPAMLEVIRGVYHAANKMLIARGVLPDYKRSYGAPTQAPARVGVQPASGGSMAGPGAGGSMPGAGAPASFMSGSTAAGTVATIGAPHGAATQPAPVVAFAPLDRLLSAARAGTRSAAPATAFAPGATSPGMVTIQVRPELLAALRALETRFADDAVPGGLAEAAPRPYPPDIDHAKRAMAATLTPSDVVIADLVAALFDRLFADRRLLDATKAQVARLQLPVFKSIMKDPSFFSDAKHPIRQLIDTIAELGAGEPSVLVDECAPEEWIAAAVQNIVDGQDDDPTIIGRERERLADILERHLEAALEADAEVLALRERERHLVAMREATLTIAHRIAAAAASEHAASFLYRCWREVMVNDYLDGGDSTIDWRADLEVVEDVLWVLVPRVSAEDRTRLASLLPSLIYRMKLGFLRARVESGDAAARVEEMRVLLDEVMRAPVAAAHGIRRKAAPAPASDDYTATLHASGAVMEEGLARGTWMEFSEPDGEVRRCRLTWVSPVQGACVFKDLERNRSFAISLDDLRERRRAGTATAVDGPGVAAASVDAAIADVARGLEADGRIMPRNPS